MSNGEEDEKIYTFIPCCIGKPLNMRWNEIKNGFELEGSSIMRDLVKVICSAFGEYIFVKMYDELGENKLVLGKDIFMNDPVSRYVYSDRPTQVFIRVIVYYINPKYRVSVQNTVYNAGLKWPPADNFDDVCPINLEPIGQYEGYGGGTPISDPHISNIPPNVLVIEYTNGHRRAYNKAAYRQIISTIGNDPLTNAQVSDHFKITLMIQLAKNPNIPFHHFFLT